MAKAGPEAGRRGSAKQPQRRGLGTWLRGLRFSGFSIIMAVVVVIGVGVLAPTLSAVIAQRQQIAALQQSVDQTRADIGTATAEVDRWKDPAYVQAQAHNRLFYVLPGQTQLLTIDDVTLPDTAPKETSDSVTQVSGDWLSGIANSVLLAGAGNASDPAAPAGTPTPDPSPSPTPGPAQ